MERSKIGNHLTPWGRVIPDKLTDSQLVKKFPRAVWNSKVYHRIHKRPAPVRILSRITTAHASPTHLFHSNIILPSILKS